MSSSPDGWTRTHSESANDPSANNTEATRVRGELASDVQHPIKAGGAGTYLVVTQNDQKVERQVSTLLASFEDDARRSRNRHQLARIVNHGYG